nr:hypothetical protein [uncultured Blautia sp.]
MRYKEEVKIAGCALALCVVMLFVYMAIPNNGLNYLLSGEKATDFSNENIGQNTVITVSESPTSATATPSPVATTPVKATQTPAEPLPQPTSSVPETTDTSHTSDTSQETAEFPIYTEDTYDSESSSDSTQVPVIVDEDSDPTTDDFFSSADDTDWDVIIYPDQQ